MGRHSKKSDKSQPVRPVRDRAKNLHIGDAGLPARTAAFFVDLVALAIIDLMIVSLAILIELQTGFALSTTELLAAVAIVDSLYFVVLWSAGRTVGMSALNLRVAAKDGGRLALHKSFIRFLFLLVSMACAGLGVLWMAFGKSKRGWHDLAAGSRVVAEDGETGLGDTQTIGVQPADPRRYVHAPVVAGEPAEEEAAETPAPKKGPAPGSVIRHVPDEDGY
ncbi:MAG: RDD family protein [Candidatus Aquicultorales bacterium]